MEARMSVHVKFVTDRKTRAVINQIARRAHAMDWRANGALAGTFQHHAMNISAAHANGNPLRLADLLDADALSFAHDVFGIDRHLCRDTGQLLHCFLPRFSCHGEVAQ